jgi:hypothetical protein
VEFALGRPHNTFHNTTPPPPPGTHTPSTHHTTTQHTHTRKTAHSSDPTWCAVACRAVVAWRALRAAAFLHAHDPASLPRFAATLRLAAADIVLAHREATLATSAAPPGPSLPACLPPAPLASGHARVPLAGLPSRAPHGGRDATLEQAAKDAKRDVYVVNGERFSGAEVGFGGVVDAALRCATRGGAAAGGGAPTPLLRGALAEALRRAGRTCSAGDSFEAAQRALGLGGADGAAFLSADSAGAAPISLAVGDVAAAEGPRRAPLGALEGALAALRAAGSAGEEGADALPGALAWASGLRTGLCVALRAPSSYFLVRAAGAAEPVRVARVAAEWSQSFVVCDGELFDAEGGFVDVVVEAL